MIQESTPQHLVTFIKTINQQQHHRPIRIKPICLHDTRDNQSLEERRILKTMSELFLSIQVLEHAYNCKVEWKFATLYGRIQSMLNSVCIPANLCEGIRLNATKTATNTENSNSNGVCVRTLKIAASLSLLRPGRLEAHPLILCWDIICLVNCLGHGRVCPNLMLKQLKLILILNDVSMIQ